MRIHPKRTQGEFLQFFFPSPHEAAVFPSASVARNMCGGSIRMSSSAKVLDLDGWLSSENPTMIMVIVLCGRVLSERTRKSQKSANPSKTLA